MSAGRTLVNTIFNLPGEGRTEAYTLGHRIGYASAMVGNYCMVGQVDRAAVWSDELVVWGERLEAMIGSAALGKDALRAESEAGRLAAHDSMALSGQQIARARH